METASVPGWRALLTDWTDLVRHNPDGFETEEGQKAIARLVERHGGYVEDTGGGVEVGFVGFQAAAKEVEINGRTFWVRVLWTATVTDEMIALWIGDEPFVDMPTEEVFAAEVTR